VGPWAALSQAEGAPGQGGRREARPATGTTAAAMVVGCGGGMGHRGCNVGGLKFFSKCGRGTVRMCEERRFRCGCEILANVGYRPVHSSVN
jgi:hypothetical protein